MSKLSQLIADVSRDDSSAQLLDREIEMRASANSEQDRLRRELDQSRAEIKSLRAEVNSFKDSMRDSSFSSNHNSSGPNDEIITMLRERFILENSRW